MGSLVLSRENMESVEVSIPGLDRPLVITVMDIKSNKHGRRVRLAFEADPRIVIDRSEVAAAKRMGVARERAVSLRPVGKETR